MVALQGAWAGWAASYRCPQSVCPGRGAPCTTPGSSPKEMRRAWSDGFRQQPKLMTTTHAACRTGDPWTPMRAHPHTHTHHQGLGADVQPQRPQREVRHQVLAPRLVHRLRWAHTGGGRGARRMRLQRSGALQLVLPAAPSAAGIPRGRCSVPRLVRRAAGEHKHHSTPKNPKSITKLLAPGARPP